VRCRCCGSKLMDSPTGACRPRCTLVSVSHSPDLSNHGICQHHPQPRVRLRHVYLSHHTTRTLFLPSRRSIPSSSAARPHRPSPPIHSSSVDPLIAHVMPTGRGTARHPCVLSAKANMGALVSDHHARATSGRRYSKG
jgi:hypothetical protein